MSERITASGLEEALLERAQKLADEYIARAEQTRARMIQEANERLHIREQREVLAAQAEAERLYRRKVQANELKLQGKLDRMRWSLIQSVMQGLPEQLEAITQNENRYLTLLGDLLRHAADSIESDNLVAELNAADLQRLKEKWESFAEKAVPGKQIRLCPEPCTCRGGIRVHSEDNRIRVDNTFEGRIERMSELLQQSITERLFVGAINKGGLIRG